MSTSGLKILLTGKNGQVGHELERSLQGLGTVIAPDRQQMDLSNPDQLRAFIRATEPDLIINPAAYTAVDLAESEPELAMRINAEAPGLMAEEAARLGATLIHFSTDYVFDGSKQGAYLETDVTNPLSVYGKTKLAGEQAILAADCAHLILRTSWIYGLRGKNFLLTMLRLGRERDSLRVVADQFGAPTWSRTLAEVTAHVVAQSLCARSLSASHGADKQGADNHATDSARNRQHWWRERSGIYHVTAQGQTSWHGFTEAILAQAGLDKPCTVEPITTLDYPTPARRPANSALSCARFMQQFCGLPQWDAALALCMQR
jgi:dTDP-4-dehydrorhamnose reductase